MHFRGLHSPIDLHGGTPRPLWSIVRLALIVAIISGVGRAAEPGTRPNVLLIIIDDFHASLSSTHNPASPVRTPNMERLAARGTWFSRAYNVVPLCGPSRAALLSGVHAANSGVYFNDQPPRRSDAPIARARNLPRQFLDAGYLVAGFGKITHNQYIEDDLTDYTPGYYRMFNRKPDVTYTDSELSRFVLDRSAEPDFGMLPDTWDRDDPARKQQDTEQADRTIRLLREDRAPFFIACGFWRPHLRWYSPKRYFDRYPLESIALPVGFRADDLEDVPEPGRWLAAYRGNPARDLDPSRTKRRLQAYYAAISYVDEQVGRVLDALEASPARDETIIVFLGDNGYHAGEKGHWGKRTLWEVGCRVPLSIIVPGAPRQVCASPVSLLDLYPTLLRLCGLPDPETHRLDGVDLSAIVAGRATDRGRPVVMTFGRGNHAVRDERHRYIRYHNGAEELYVEDDDPHEWFNVAGLEELRDVKKSLRSALPRIDAPEIAFMSEPEDRLPDAIFGRRE